MLRTADLRTIPKSSDEPALRRFCERRDVTELDLFGSVLGKDFRSDSDIDVLVTLAEDRRPTLLTLVHMEEELRQVSVDRWILCFVGRWSEVKTTLVVSTYSTTGFLCISRHLAHLSTRI